MNWTSKKVLVTGAGGFIGSHLAERLVREGARVRALVHYNALGTWGWLETSEYKGQMEIVPGDILDHGSVYEALKGTEIVFHLAALIAIPYSYRAPTSFVRTNVEGTLNVLTAARQLELERVVHTSTSEVYGTAQYVPIDEKHPLKGQSPYSASKIGADKFAESFHLSFGLPVVTVRPFNTFGPRQSARAVVPTIITQCLTEGAVRLGNLNPTRDLNFVANTVSGFLAAGGSAEAEGCVVNLGSGRETSIDELARLIAEKLGKSITIEQEDARLRPPGSEVERLLADSSLARRLLGWLPEVELSEGLDITIEWVRRNIDKYKAGIYVV